eukprot:TRINITY_DN3468_c3_g1_i1.p1 TRINITY_DN3468_c3_g1~~TRINITY_DN3468_c3_g1_i1.p1  ORF type:complete len:157 (+),score=29.33 TRINITY_DN3468_c3_g1_i1:67-537(+)
MDRKTVALGGFVMSSAACAVCFNRCVRGRQDTEGTGLVEYKNTEFKFLINHHEGYDVVVSRHTGCVLFEVTKEGHEPITIVMEELKMDISLGDYSECAAVKTVEELRSIDNSNVSIVPCSSTIKNRSGAEFVQWQILHEPAGTDIAPVNVWNGYAK